MIKSGLLKKTIIIGISSLIFILSPVYADRNSKLSLKVLGTKIFKLQNINADQSVKNKINESLLNYLDKIKYLKKLPDNKICYNEKNAIEEAKKIGVNFAVFGKVTRIKKLIDSRPLGKEGKEQYVIKNTFADIYHIELFFIRIFEGKILYKINEKVLLPGVNEILNKFTAEVEKYYTLQIGSIDEAPLPQNEIIQIDPMKETFEQQKEIINPQLEIVIKTTVKLKFYASTGITYLQPFGIFQKLAVNPFLGPFVNIGLRNLLFENSIINLNFGYYFLTQNTYFVNLYNIASLGLGLGYYFQLPKNFNLSPILSGGYTFHIYKDVFSTGIETFNDPFVKIECEVGYSFNKTISIYLTPGFTLFFEKTLAGYYLSVDLGVKFTF